MDVIILQQYCPGQHAPSPRQLEIGVFRVSAVVAQFVQIYCFKGESTLWIDRSWNILNIMKNLTFRCRASC